MQHVLGPVVQGEESGQGGWVGVSEGEVGGGLVPEPVPALAPEVDVASVLRAAAYGHQEGGIYLRERKAKMKTSCHTSGLAFPYQLRNSTKPPVSCCRKSGMDLCWHRLGLCQRWGRVPNPEMTGEMNDTKLFI